MNKINTQKQQKIEKKGTSVQQKIKICQGCFRTCLWHVKGKISFCIQKGRIQETQCESCYHCTSHLCIVGSNPCLPRWPLRVERLHLIEADKSARNWLSLEEYKGWRHDQVGTCVHWRLCQKFDFDCSHNRPAD